MAEIAPFRGLRYNLNRVRELADVVIPPYDVISPAEQALFYEASPYNMVRLELGKVMPEDSPADNPHVRAARYMEEWLQDGVLIRDAVPGIYHYELEYALAAGGRKTRYGFICVLRLEDFSSGFVRPHEKTFQAVKDERLGLMLSCKANLSPVFALYTDPEQAVDGALRKGREAAPILAFEDRKGLRHRMWRVEKLEVLQHVRALMQDKTLFIADGHHRYETALNYRNIQRERFPNASPRASFEYLMIYLSNANQEGMTILPTHRLLRHLEGWEPEGFLDRARAFFDIRPYKVEGEWRSALEKARSAKETAIGFAHGTAGVLYLLSARRAAVRSALTECQVPEVLQDLDVVVLDQVILRHLLGLPETFLSSAQNICFKHELKEAVEGVRSGAYEAGFLINATRMEQVQEVASAGLIMPHKSTYFYPKVGSGLVIHSLSPGEEAIW